MTSQTKTAQYFIKKLKEKIISSEFSIKEIKTKGNTFRLVNKKRII